MRIVSLMLLALPCIATWLWPQSVPAACSPVVMQQASAAAEDEPTDGSADAAGGQPTTSDDPLISGQRGVAERFSRLENLLLRSAELEQGENPTRAALLQRAVQLAKQVKLSSMLAAAADNLESQQYSEAIEQQKVARERLNEILELLQSENRGERVREERDKVRRWIEETDRLLRLQGSLRGRTEGGQDFQKAATDQQQLTDRARQITQDISGDQESPDQAAPSSASNSQSEEASSESNHDGQSESDTETAGDSASESDADSRSQESSESDDGEGTEAHAPSEADIDSSEEDSSDKQQKGQEGSGEAPGADHPPDDQPNSPGSDSEQQRQPGQQGQQSQSSDPMERARQKIEQARERMEAARKRLDQAEREGAVEDQRQAEDMLREAIEDFEEQLRQLREEEIERSLASLEDRLRRMLDMQAKVLDETQRLQKISGEQASRQITIQAGNLSREERSILAEGQRASLLLREEGSSSAFPEAIQQVNQDISNVADRLEQADVGRLTVVIEQEIVRSLEEMIEALVDIQQENEERKQQQQQQQMQQQAAPGEQPLVNKLAELRLIRTLQRRINHRTDTMAEMLDDPSDAVGQATEADILTELKNLSQRQSSIQEVTRDIVVGAGE